MTRNTEIGRNNEIGGNNGIRKTKIFASMQKLIRNIVQFLLKT